MREVAQQLFNRVRPNRGFPGNNRTFGGCSRGRTREQLQTVRLFLGRRVYGWLAWWWASLRRNAAWQAKIVLEIERVAARQYVPKSSGAETARWGTGP